MHSIRDPTGTVKNACGLEPGVEAGVAMLTLTPNGHRGDQCFLALQCSSGLCWVGGPGPPVGYVHARGHNSYGCCWGPLGFCA